MLNIWILPFSLGSGILVSLAQIREREKERGIKMRDVASDMESTSGQGTEPRRHWSGFKFKCPGMTQPRFELEPIKQTVE